MNRVARQEVILFAVIVVFGVLGAMATTAVELHADRGAGRCSRAICSGSSNGRLPVRLGDIGG